MSAAEPVANAASSQQRRPRTRKSIANMPSNTLSEDKENTAPVMMNSAAESVAERATSKKSRSKSIGPGGLDALQQGSGNRRMSAVMPLPKSILMPTIPLSPLREIPTRRSSPQKNYASPTRSSEQKSLSSSKTSSNASPSRSPTRTLQIMSAPQETEEEMQARRAEKERVQKQREARRKSMAARRVSFAPEATLHTWDVLEAHESTMSSASTGSARHSAASRNSMFSNAPDDLTATPTEHSDDNTEVARSPEQHRDESQSKRRRRSSTIPPMNFNDPDALSSSDYASDSENEGDDRDSSGNNVYQQPSSPSDSAQADDGDASMDLTGITNGHRSPLRDESASDGQELDKVLRQATDQAGRKPLEYDEDGDVSMELAGDDVTAAFKPWVQKSMGAASPHPNPRNRLSSQYDQENVIPGDSSPTPSSAGTEDMSMDITRAVGGIVQQNTNKPLNRRQSIRSRRASMAPAVQAQESDGTMAMDFTTAVGGIQPRLSTDHLSQMDENEELSMEFTTVFGGLKSQAQTNGRQQQHSDTQDAEDEGDQMEMTTAVGGILNKTRKSLATTRRGRPSITASATGSPAVGENKFASQIRKDNALSIDGTPEKMPGTPSKQLTPQPKRPHTPSKTPPSANVVMRTASPKKLFQAELKASRSPLATTSKLFKAGHNGSHTPNVVLAPNSVKDMERRLSTMDPTLSGSPRLAAILSRRASIGDQAERFSPKPIGAAAVRFVDPKAMEAEVDRERDEDIRRESGRYVLERETDDNIEEENATVTLREMMHSMTPKKNNAKAKPRKSLHVGAAKGILGKRPAELDESEDEHSPFRGREASPVKKIRLQAPPQMVPTRKSLSFMAGNDQPATPQSSSPSRPQTASTPKSHGRFKDAEIMPNAQAAITTFGEQTDPSDAAVFDAHERENIKLQDFLNMTGIRFMDSLDTTKRRHTLAPQKKGENGQDDFLAKDAAEIFEEAAVAGATTVPLYDLFQHACHETKQYIRGGRKILRQLEDQSCLENPAVFQRYLAASPTERAKMDAQFRNVKMHARSLSKASWYEWRSKLWDGLKDSLLVNSNGLNEDLLIVEETERHVEEALPTLFAEKERLAAEHTYLSDRAKDLKGSDPKELSSARESLRAMDAELRAKREQLEIHQKDLEERTAALSHAKDIKAENEAVIKEAHRRREECRGWSMAEVRKLRSDVAALEKTTGWSISSASGTTLTMVFRGQLQLYFDTAAFLPVAALTHNKRYSASQAAGNAPISLTYIGDAAMQPLSTEKRFFLQIMRAHLQSLHQAQTDSKDLLRFVSRGWCSAITLVDEITRLHILAPAHCEIISDERMVVKTSILLRETQSKVDIAFEVGVTANGQYGLDLRMDSAGATCIYGEAFKETKIKEFLEGFVRNAGAVSGIWAGAVAELSKKLATRGKRS